MAELKEFDLLLLESLQKLYTSLTTRGNRLSKHDYYMLLAKVVSARATCWSRKVGAVLVRDNIIISTGYCGAPKGYPNCCDLGYCIRKEAPVGTALDDCPSVHAEANCINQAALEGHSTKESTMYVTTQPCKWCISASINAGIKKIIYNEPYPSELSNKIAEACDIEVISFEELRE